YIVGLAAFVSGDPGYAERMLLSAEGMMKQVRFRPPGFSRIAERLPLQILDLYRMWHAALSKAYFHSRHPQDLVNAERIALAILVRDPSDYSASLVMAIADFVFRRDTKSAIHRVWAFRKQRDQTWRFSYAFLLAYTGRMREARDQYRIAFNGVTSSETVPVQAEEFIQMILDEEPEKCQLHFASALINLHAKGDLTGARRDLHLFVVAEGAETFAEELALSEGLLQAIDAKLAGDQIE
ncbi:MAG: hypothetical protein ABMA00_08340, partial [Gemmatimonas sp.]